jgi:hypothetical protein
MVFIIDGCPVKLDLQRGLYLKNPSEGLQLLTRLIYRGYASKKVRRCG